MQRIQSDSILEKKINSLESFDSMLANNTPTAFHLAKQYPRIAKLITLKFFEMLCKSPIIDMAYAKDLVEIAVCGDIIKNKRDLSLICQSNIYLSSLLLNDNRFEKYSNDLKKYAHFNYLVTMYRIDNPREQKRQLKRQSLFALNLDSSIREEKKDDLDNRKSILDSLLDENAKKTALKIMARHFATSKSFTENMMFGPTGYYSSGKVKFNSDFTTYASDPLLRKGLSMALANQLFAVRQRLIRSGKLLKNDIFDVLECGAGNGDLCVAILDRIADMAGLNAEWKEFYQAIYYHIIEKSPELVKRQEQNTCSHKKTVFIICADSRAIDLGTLKKPMAAVISNELLDIFGAHEVVLNAEGKFSPTTTVLTTTEELLRNYFIPCGAKISIKELKEKSKVWIELCRMFQKSFDKAMAQLPKDVIFLSEKDFLGLHPYAIKGLNVFDVLQFNVLDCSFYPELTSFLERNPDFCPNSEPSQPRYVEDGILPYLKSIQAILIESGEVISIDYGGDAFTTVQCLKTFDGKQVGQNIFDDPSFNDITRDVNFTVAAEEGIKLGLQPVFFGKQNQMIIRENDPISIRGKVEFVERSSVETFQILVQRKVGESETVKKEENSEDMRARFTGKCVPVTHAQLFRRHLDKAMSLSPHARLLEKAETICRGKANFVSYLQALATKQYALALRKACSIGSGPHIDLILSYITLLDININEVSSNGYSALDWIQNAKISVPVKDEIVKKLTALDAKNGKDIIEISPKRACAS